MHATAIRLLILDVDGVLTRGDIAPDADGDRGKTFHVRDGHAIKLWQRAAGKVAILSGRRSDHVDRRAAELGIALVRQGASDKLAMFPELLEEAGCRAVETAYVGDDLPDVPIMGRCGLAIAVADAAAEVKRAAHHVTRRPGGCGAVAEAVEWLLRRQDQWNRASLYST